MTFLQKYAIIGAIVMKLKKIKNQRKYKKLYKYIKPIIEYNHSNNKNEDAAKKLLYEFFKHLEKIKPSKELNLSRIYSYYSFFINLIPLRQELIKNNYSDACHELITLYEYEPILQNRIYQSLLLLNKEYLEN